MTLANVTDRIKGYLPTFIKLNAIMGSILDAIGQSMLDLYTLIIGLPDTGWTDTGIRQEVKDWKIYASGTESVATLQGFLQSRYTIHLARGTQAGCLADIKRVSGDINASINVLDQAHSGWWADTTYPGQSARTFLEAERVIEITMLNKSKYTDDQLKEIIRRELVPINFTTVFL